MVFIDDNPVERDIVRKVSGIVSVPDIGNDVTRYREILDGSELFNITSLSEEDKKEMIFTRIIKEQKQLQILLTITITLNHYK